MNYLNMLNGYDIIVTTKKFQIRTHQKKRINKKWAKRYGFMYFDIQEKGQVVIVGSTIYMTQMDFDELIEEMRKNGCKGIDGGGQ